MWSSHLGEKGQLSSPCWARSAGVQWVQVLRLHGASFAQDAAATLCVVRLHGRRHICPNHQHWSGYLLSGCWGTLPNLFGPQPDPQGGNSPVPLGPASSYAFWGMCFPGPGVQHGCPVNHGDELSPSAQGFAIYDNVDARGSNAALALQSDCNLVRRSPKKHNIGLLTSHMGWACSL